MILTAVNFPTGTLSRKLLKNCITLVSGENYEYEYMEVPMNVRTILLIIGTSRIIFKAVHKYDTFRWHVYSDIRVQGLCWSSIIEVDNLYIHICVSYHMNTGYIDTDIYTYDIYQVSLEGVLVVVTYHNQVPGKGRIISTDPGSWVLLDVFG